MDDSFKSRVEKIFGSLRSSESSSLQQQHHRPPLWSLTDDEVEKREWRRDSAAADRDDDVLCSSSLHDLLKEKRKYTTSRKQLDDDLDDLDDDDDDDDGNDDQSRSCRGINGGDDEWEIRSCVGMDSTLDNEEEEDEFDKVATGRENAGERLYMSDISDHGSYLNSQNVLHNALNHISNEDRSAARIRLKEDDEEAQKFNKDNGYKYDPENKESNVEGSNSGSQLRSILKRKDNDGGSKPQKRVRFDPACKNEPEELSEKFEDYPMSSFPNNSQDSDGGSNQAENVRSVPDYILNPSRYTCYSFDSSSEVDGESNAEPCMDYLKIGRRSKSEPDDAPLDLPKSVNFIPKRKSGNAQPGSTVVEVEIKEKEDESTKSLHPTVLPVSIAAGATEHYGANAMEADEAETSAADSSTVQKCSRNYRVKSQSDDSDI